ncbi:unnamed protein product [Tilletia controversa]|nr:unnamed protein product [Tilletia controversa]
MASPLGIGGSSQHGRRRRGFGHGFTGSNSSDGDGDGDGEERYMTGQRAGLAVSADSIVPPSDESDADSYESDGTNSVESELDFRSRVAGEGNERAGLHTGANANANASTTLELSEGEDEEEEGDVSMDIVAHQGNAIYEEQPAMLPSQPEPVSRPVRVFTSTLSSSIEPKPFRIRRAEPTLDFSQTPVIAATPSPEPEPSLEHQNGREAGLPDFEEELPGEMLEVQMQNGTRQRSARTPGPSSSNSAPQRKLASGSTSADAPEPPRKKRKRGPAKVPTEVPPPAACLEGPPVDYIAQSWAARGSSLRSFWSSFSFTDDGEPVSRRKLHSDIRESARQYIELDIMAAKGLQFEEDYNVDLLRDGADLNWLRQEDHQHHLVAAAIEQSSELRDFRKHRTKETARIAKMVKLYWVRKSDLEEKQRRAQERGIKSLAKWTAREVIKQWKLAADFVGHQKEEAERKEHELEGRKQLNAILEQSTQMLNIQRTDLYGEEAASELMDTDSEASDGEGADVEDSDLEEDEGSDGDAQGSIDEAHAMEGDEGIDGDAEGSIDEAHVMEEDGGNDEDAEGSVDEDHVPNTTSAIPTSVLVEGTPDAEEIVDDSEASLIDDSGASLIDDSGESLIDDSGASLSGSSAPESDESEDDDASVSSNTEATPVDVGSNGVQTSAGGSELLEPASSKSDPSKWWARFLVSNEVEEVAPGKPGIVELEDDDAPFTEPSSTLAVVEDVQPSNGSLAAGRATTSRLALSTDSSLASPQNISGKSSASLTPLQDVVMRKKVARNGSRSASVQSSSKASKAADRDGDQQDASPADKPKVRIPFLLRGTLRPYQHVGLDWLANLYSNQVNGILADEMGLGKTIQTIALLAHLACDYGIWGPHLVVAPTSVMLNWEVEFKKFLPGFKILTYYGTQKERKEKRVGWSQENAFNVCITSYQLTLADAHILRRRSWQYLILDEAHHIKNFRSQRWQTLLGFNAQRRLLLTGTPLQNNLLDLWSLMYFLMPQNQKVEGYGAFASLQDFHDWFSKPIDKAIEAGGPMNEETKEMVSKLHTVLRPFLLRRLKKDVEKQLPSKHEHVISCRLSKRQRFLYNDFMSRAKTKESLASGSYLSIINCLMQLRKVCNHPDLFEERPIVTSFAMGPSVVASFEIKELLIRRRMLQDNAMNLVDFEVLNGDLTAHEHLQPIATRSIQKLAATSSLPYFKSKIPPPLPMDTWSIEVFPKIQARAQLIKSVQRWQHFASLNARRCSRQPIYGSSLIEMLQVGSNLLTPSEEAERERRGFLKRSDKIHAAIQSSVTRKTVLDPFIDRFAVVTPAATTSDLPKWALPGVDPSHFPELEDPSFDTLHSVATKLHIAFPDSSLLQYDCGKLQQLDILMRRLKQGGHRILIFTQMTKMLDILESFLNYHGYRYLRLDGATKIDQRQLLTERFNRDPRIDAFILSTRSGGLGINLVGADTVLFYDLDWNAAIEAQCMDRAHRIGQTRDVHIYRFVSEHTVEENMLRKANQKRQLNSVVIQEGEFNTETLVRNDWRDMFDEGGQTIAGVPVGRAAASLGTDADRQLKAVEDEEDVQAAEVAEEEVQLDRTDYAVMGQPVEANGAEAEAGVEGQAEEEEASIDNYMIK